MCGGRLDEVLVGAGDEDAVGVTLLGTDSVGAKRIGEFSASEAREAAGT